MFDTITEGIRDILPGVDTKAEQKKDEIQEKIKKIEEKRELMGEAPPVLTLGEIQEDFPINPLYVAGGALLLFVILN